MFIIRMLIIAVYVYCTVLITNIATYFIVMFMYYCLYALFCIFCFHCANWHSPTTLTEGFPYFFLSCKAYARVYLAKTGHGRTLPN